MPQQFIYYRYLILFIGFFCLISIASNMITINFALICMNDPNDNVTLRDGVSFADSRAFSDRSNSIQLHADGNFYDSMGRFGR